MIRGRITLKLLFPALVPIFLSACGGEEKISYSQDVQPILEANCLSCHQAGGQFAGGPLSGDEVCLRALAERLRSVLPEALQPEPPRRNG